MKEIYENLQSPIDNFYHWEKNEPNRPFLRQPYGDKWHTLTYAEAGQEARKMATALQGMGLQKGDHIGIMSKNCYHWILADLAIMMGGFVSVPFYATLPKDSLNTVLEKSDSKALFVGKMEKWGDRAEGIPDDVKVIHFPHYEGNAKITVGESWDDLVKNNAPMKDSPSPDLDDLWSILFTSGTTGTPKGAMHLFKNPAIVMRIEELTQWIGLTKYEKPKYFSFLPLNHIAERIAVETSCLNAGGCISFAESLDTFAKNLQETQPTVLFAVPRIWTKFYLGVLAKMPQKRLDMLFKIPFVSGMIKNKLKTALGLKALKIAATGAAITPGYLKDWYKKLGVHLVEAYGMTEVCGSITNGPSPDNPQDSVGQVVPYCEIKIHPETQEILMKAPYQMTGYYKDPVKSAEILRDGWIYSGDRGTVDEKGFVRVVGRVKDAFKTSKGQYIIPNPIEEGLVDNTYAEQLCVAGLGIPQPICLVNLSELGLEASKEEVEASLKAEVDQLNKTLSGYQRISTVIINQEPWSEDNGLLTPTLKVRRGAIDDKYGNQYLAWHEDKRQVIWA